MGGDRMGTFPNTVKTDYSGVEKSLWNYVRKPSEIRYVRRGNNIQCYTPSE